MRFYIDGAGTPTNNPATVAWYNGGDNAGGACPIGDLSIDDTRNTADMRYRCSDVAFGLPAKRNPITAEFRLVFGIDAGLHSLLKTAYEQAEVRFCWFLSDDISVVDATGPIMPMFVSAYPHDQPLEDVAGHDMTLTYGYMEDAGGLPIPPAWQTVE